MCQQNLRELPVGGGGGGVGGWVNQTSDCNVRVHVSSFPLCFNITSIFSLQKKQKAALSFYFRLHT